MEDWLEIKRGDRPLIVTFPHTGTHVPDDISPEFFSLSRARKDTDWWVDQLYAFAVDLGATTIRTSISRSIIDVNRDPSGASLYPGQTTTGLCPLTTFDGEPLYRDGHEPGEDEIARRRAAYHQPYHDAIQQQIDRLIADHGQVVLYDAHSIRSKIPRLFDDLLPIFSIGTNHDQTCSLVLGDAVENICVRSGKPTVRNGRFRGGWTTRHYGQPDRNVHAIQMELACRGYLDEPLGDVGDDIWPVPFEVERAAPFIETLRQILTACLEFAENQ
ncbi:N-formylglutamate deformylase [Henriciella sp.]|uniref:N-formylglutamate deformylase n=1 Tax=Henriciella sp. TaxID=1968823 RepID=UPI003C755607